MRTLKKTLALVLCLAMMVGLCAFGASAKDFTDAEEIEYAEEVGLLTGIGVIDGIPVGDEFKFDPTGILTREQAAKIITAMLGYGEIAPKAAPFTDVPSDRWSAGYIATCAGLGIVAGVGDGTFNPTGKLTAEAWQKMLLCALGYDAESEGLVGASWEVGVAKLVKKTGLSDGITLSPVAEVSREAACKLAYNALTIPEVNYAGNTHVSTGDGTTVDINDPATRTGTYIAENFGLVVADTAAGFAKDSFRGTANADGAGAQGTDSVFQGVITQNSANSNTKKTTVSGIEFDVETGADLLGHYVKVYTSKTANAQGYAKVYSVQDIGKTVTVPAATANATGWAKYFGSAAVTVDANFWEFGAFQTAAAQVASGVTVGTIAPAGTYILSAQNAIKARINPTYSQVKLSKVSKIDNTAGKETITLAGYGAALDNGKKNAAGAAVDRVNEYTGIAVGDFVVVTTMGISAADSIYNVTKAETVTGTITAVGTAATNENDLTIDGTTYSFNDTAAVAGNVVTGVTFTAGKIDLTAADIKANTYTLYLDNDGNYIACVLSEGTSVASEAMYVIYAYDKVESTDYGQTTKTYAQCVDASGAEQNILIGYDAAGAYNIVGGIDAANAIGDVTTYHKWVVFETDTTAGSNSALYGWKKANPALPAAIGSVTLGATNMSPVVTSLSIGGQTYYLNSATNYIFWNTLTGAQMKTEVKTGAITMNGFAGEVLFGLDADNNKIVKAIVNAGAYAAADVDAGVVLYVGSNTATGTVAAGKTYTAYKCDTGEKITITCAASTVVNANKFYNYTEKDGIYKLTELADGTNVKYGREYTGKLGSKILADTPPTDTTYDVTADTADAVAFVDLRAANTIGAEGALTSLDAIATAIENDPLKKVTIDLLLTKQGTVATIVFVRSFA